MGFNRNSSIVCLFCENVKFLDHVFSCRMDSEAHKKLLDAHMATWKASSGQLRSFSCVFQLLSSCSSNFAEAFSVFKDPKIASCKVVDFVHSFRLAYRNNIWLVPFKHRALMEKGGLILCDGTISVVVTGPSSVLSSGVVKLLGIAEAFGVSFGMCKSCLFFSDIGDFISVRVDA
ncbi:hypothetical protein G9A89_021525 [Geosiphon pyriformis]|nr:hypothetical protein G9A89_021525 [Geosiphon pyriformis]